VVLILFLVLLHPRAAVRVGQTLARLLTLARQADREAVLAVMVLSQAAQGLLVKVATAVAVLDQT
jgi:hypothetical protein